MWSLGDVVPPFGRGLWVVRLTSFRHNCKTPIPVAAGVLGDKSKKKQLSSEQRRSVCLIRDHWSSSEFCKLTTRHLYPDIFLLIFTHSTNWWSCNFETRVAWPKWLKNISARTYQYIWLPIMHSSGYCTCTKSTKDVLNRPKRATGMHYLPTPPRATYIPYHQACVDCRAGSCGEQSDCKASK